MCDFERGTERRAEDGWTEKDSAHFIDRGRYYVPEREAQIEAMCSLVPRLEVAHDVLDLCCGEGLLTRALLDRLPDVRVIALDGSEAMLESTERLAGARAERLVTRRIDLADTSWRQFASPLRAVVSSLAVHHLDGAGKRRLFCDLARVLAPGGALVIADLIAPTTSEAVALAAATWDEEVCRRARALDGNEGAFERFQIERWNYYSDPSPDPVDQPSPLLDQLLWMREAGLEAVDVHWMKAGHAIFSGRKPAR